MGYADDTVSSNFKPLALEELCRGYVVYEGETWRRTFEELGLSFNTENFIREAAPSLDHAIRSALFFGADLKLSQIESLNIVLARAKSHNSLRRERSLIDSALALNTLVDKLPRFRSQGVDIL